jgi:16S rRNA (cytosine967-C5)-methyltransferase
VSRRRAPRRADHLAARRGSLRVLLAAGGDLRFELAFERELRRRPLDPKDRALALNIASGTLKLRRRLDFIIDRFLEPRHKPLPGPIQQILRMGVYQLTALSRVPRFAAVNTSVELAKQWGHTGTARLVNAILRRISSADGDWPWPDRKQDVVNHLATVYSYPNWIVRHWTREHGEAEAERLCRLGNLAAGLTLRLVRETEWPEALLKQVEKQAPGSLPGRWFTEYRFLPDPPPVADLTAVASGDLTVQNEAAACSTYLLDLQPNDTLLEVGAAPGGKSSHAARFVGPQGLVLALDVNVRRMRRLRENLIRTEQPWVVPVRADGRKLPVSRVDKILIDAPCSALGLLHRHPDLRWQKQIVDIARLTELQRALVEAGLDALSPGGRLVYSTCSTTREENEGLLARVLERRTDVTVVDPRPLMPAGVPANAHWITIEPDPPQLDGAFACALKKTQPV